MENVTKKEADGIKQPCECREDETEKFNVFIQEMVTVFDKGIIINHNKNRANLH